MCVSINLDQEPWTGNTGALGTQVRSHPDYETNTNTFYSFQFRNKSTRNYDRKHHDAIFSLLKKNISQAKWSRTDRDVSWGRTLQQSEDQQAFYVNLLGPMSRCNCAAGRRRTGCVPVVQSGGRFDVPLAQSALLRSHVLVHSVGWNNSFAQTTRLHHHAWAEEIISSSCWCLLLSTRTWRAWRTWLCGRPSHHSRLCT